MGKIGKKVLNMYILMDYHTTCEVCGKRIDGVVAKHSLDNDSVLFGNAINDVLDTVDSLRVKKALEKQVDEREWDTLNFSNGVSRHRCPHCGAHQSWEKLPEPIEPENPKLKKSKSGNIGAAVILGVIGGIIGMLAGLFIMIFTNTMGLIISSVVGIVLGFVLGLWAGNAADKDEIESYPKKVEEYREYVKEYNEFKESLKTRTVKYEPEVNINSARLSRKTDENTEEEWPGLRKMM